MSKILNLKPIINKKNKQVNINFPKKDMPKKLKEILKHSPTNLKKLKFELKGWE